MFLQRLRDHIKKYLGLDISKEMIKLLFATNNDQTY